jgi:hypothetical protein
MVDRHFFGDLALAVLLALPLAGLAKPQAVIHDHQIAKPPAISTASADRTPGGRISVFS